MEKSEATEREPANIIKVLREHSNYTIKEFAEYADVSEQVVLRTEQGTYSDVPPSISQAISKLHNMTFDEIKNEYANYKVARRKWSQKESPLVLELLNDLKSTVSFQHPFIYWRVACGYDTRMGFCIAFCVHNATLTRFEKGRSEYVPEVLYDVFCDIFGEDQALKTYTKLQRLYDKFQGKVRDKGDAA